MKRLTIQEAEALADKFRVLVRIAPNEPINVKTLLRKLGITTMYRPLSDDSYGISCKSKSGKMFMLVNCKSTRGRQHFTIAHEFYHLFYDENPTPHMCNGTATGEERNANMFATALLLPKGGLLNMLSAEEISNHKVELATILRMEQFFGASRNNLAIRLKEIGIINQAQVDSILSISVKDSARAYGYDLSLYEPGNENLLIGDFGEKARLLYESGQFSEGHYYELLNMISDGRQEN